MKDYYDAEISEAPENAGAKDYDQAALEATIKRAEPVNLGAADQMADTPVHTQGDAPDCLLQSARMAEHRQTDIHALGAQPLMKTAGSVGDRPERLFSSQTSMRWAHNR